MATLLLESICLDIENYNVLEDVSFEAKAGEITVVTGHNGCGKSNLLQCIAGNIRPSTGNIFFDDINVTRLSPLKRKAFLVGDWEIAPRTKVVDAIMVIARQWGVSSRERAQKVDEAMITMNLLHLSERRIRSLSTSERRRIYLACALAIEPKWIVADNPLAYMEEHSRQELAQNITSFCCKKEIGLIWATNSTEEAFSMADNLIVMDHGKIIQADHSRKVQQYPNSKKVAQLLNNSNIFEADLVQQAAGMAYVSSSIGDFSGMLTCPAECYKEGKKVHMCIRPESIHIEQMPADENCFTGKIETATNKGFYGVYSVKMQNKTTLKVIEQNPRFLDAGEEELYFWVAQDDVVITP